jgi:circadian clock protein KaiB
VIRLYVAGESPNSVIALSNLKPAIAHLAEGEIAVEVIDVLRHPERGLKDGILVTPTLIRVSPLPQQRVVGNLRDRAVLLAALRIGPAYDE